MAAAPPECVRDLRIELGMRRVSFVRVVVSDACVAAEVVGVGHRLPSTRRVSLTTAAALAAHGVPMVLRPPGVPADPGPFEY
ncbi:MAG: hypothetical protein LC808_33695 [Actinobacteria bacterium]|nr:hypothetical protein [Actinomycetota bacterium]